MVDTARLELVTPRCKRGVIPLHQRPIKIIITLPLKSAAAGERLCWITWEALVLSATSFSALFTQPNVMMRNDMRLTNALALSHPALGQTPLLHRQADGRLCWHCLYQSLSTLWLAFSLRLSRLWCRRSIHPFIKDQLLLNRWTATSDGFAAFADCSRAFRTLSSFTDRCIATDLLPKQIAQSLFHLYQSHCLLYQTMD